MPDEIRELSAYVCAASNFHADNSRISSGFGVAGTAGVGARIVPSTINLPLYKSLQLRLHIASPGKVVLSVEFGECRISVSGAAAGTASVWSGHCVLVCRLV